MKRLTLVPVAQAKTQATAAAKTSCSQLKPKAMKTISAIALTMFLASQSFSQTLETDPISKAKISELGFIVGDWKGTGWMLPGPKGKKIDYEQTEKVRFKLDSTAILLEAKYRYAGGKTSDHLGVLTYNKKDENYSFRTYGQNGESRELKAELIEGKFYIYLGENAHMVLWINEKGQWYEKAEYKNEGNWKTVDEMTLDREE